MARIIEMDPNRMRDLPDEIEIEEDDAATLEIVESDETLSLDEDDDETIDTVDWVSDRNRSRGRWDLEMAPQDDVDQRFSLPSDEEFDEAS